MAHKISISLTPTLISYQVLQEAKIFGIVVGGLLALSALLIVSKCVLKHSLFALRILSTMLLASLVILVPLLLRCFSLADLLLLAAACGYLLAALVRLPFALGYTPRAALLCFKAYDYLQGGLLLALCFILAAPAFVKTLQNRALLSQAFIRQCSVA